MSPSVLLFKGIIKTILDEIGDPVCQSSLTVTSHGDIRIYTSNFSSGSIHYRVVEVNCLKILIICGTQCLGNWISTMDMRVSHIRFKDKVYGVHKGHLDASRHFHIIDKVMDDVDVIVGHSFGASLAFICNIVRDKNLDKLVLFGLPCFYEPALMEKAQTPVYQCDHDILTKLGLFSHKTYSINIWQSTIGGSNTYPGKNPFSETYASSLDTIGTEKTRWGCILNSPANFITLLILKSMEIFILFFTLGYEVIDCFILWVFK